MAGGEIPLRSYEELSPDGAVNELLLRRVLYGISCRNYESAAEAIPGAIGLSSSTVSRGFVQASGAKLREMQERDLSAEDVVAIFLDGKMFAGRHDGCGPGHHNYGRQTLLRLRGDEYGERAGTDSGSPFIGWNEAWTSLKACW